MNNLTTTLKTITATIEEAGREIILPAFHSSIQASAKVDGSVVTVTDLASQQYIQTELEKLDASVAFLGEEMTEEDQLSCLQHSNGRYWCLDPLDGTSNFIAHFPGFAISLALIEQGEVQLACIHDPVRGETFTAVRGCGAQLNGQPVFASRNSQVHTAVGFIDFKRLPADLAATLAIRPPYRSQRNIGSCALEWAWLAAARAQFIIHGGEKLWDCSAGSLIASEAGCMVSDFNGQSLFPRSNLTVPILAACDSAIHASLKLQLKS